MGRDCRRPGWAVTQRRGGRGDSSQSPRQPSLVYLILIFIATLQMSKIQTHLGGGEGEPRRRSRGAARRAGDAGDRCVPEGPSGHRGPPCTRADWGGIQGLCGAGHLGPSEPGLDSGFPDPPCGLWGDSGPFPVPSCPVVILASLPQSWATARLDPS